MPELPEVEYFKKYFDTKSLNKQIRSINVKDERILDNISPKLLSKKLIGKNFKYTIRHGKYLLAKINENIWLTIHFGMTGNILYFENLIEESPHFRLIINFENGNLVYEDQRIFGRISLIKNIEELIRQKKIGPDALEITFKEFLYSIRNKKTNIKSILMNQHIIAGLGNMYADEVLFQSRVNPLTSIKNLNEHELTNIFNNIKMVLKKAINKKSNINEYPNSFLTRLRFKGASCSICGIKLKTIKILNRTTYFCPKCQV